MTLQTDPSWLPSRHGCLTASRFRDAIDFLKNGKESESRRKYRSELVAERIAGYSVERYVTPAMQRGLELESHARDLYEERTGQILGPARLFAHPDIEHFMATPDATLGNDAVVEFKVPQVHTYVNWLEAGVIPPDHIPQLACQLIVTGRRKAIFCAYCPEMPEARRLFIREYEPSAEVLEEYTAAAIQFLDEVEDLFQRVTTAEEAA
jgi:predicted phage-related endonuclease